MATIHPSTHIAPGARIAEGVEIGPHCVIGGDVTIDRGCILDAQVNIVGHTSIGRDARISSFASLGTPPQSTKPYDPSCRLVIGSGCTLGEHITINVGTKDGGGVTTIGERCRLMARSHVGHDCVVGSDVTLGVGATLAGHCDVGDFTRFDDYAAVHQFSMIGASAFIELRTFVRSDIIPFGVAAGDRGYLCGLNHAGLREREVAEDDIAIADEVYQRIFFGADTFANRMDAAVSKYAGHVVADQMFKFIRKARLRPLSHPLPLSVN